MFEKPIALIIFTVLKVFSPQIRNTPGYMISLLIFDIILEVRTNALRHKIEINSTHIRTGKIKLYVFVYTENKLYLCRKY